jgi:hypothetical protein
MKSLLPGLFVSNRSEDLRRNRILLVLRKHTTFSNAFSSSVDMPSSYQRFKSSDFKNSLKSLPSAGIAIEGPPQKFKRPQPLFDRTGQPVRNRIVRISQRRDGKLGSVQPEVTHPLLR